MFIHTVLFEIQPKEVAKYHADNKIWACYARKAKGFISYRTMRRVDHKNQYACVYEWKEKSYHNRFMKKHHDWLVDKSSARVKVLGYFNFNSGYSVVPPHKRSQNSLRPSSRVFDNFGAFGGIVRRRP